MVQFLDSARSEPLSWLLRFALGARFLLGRGWGFHFNACFIFRTLAVEILLVLQHLVVTASKDAILRFVDVMKVQVFFFVLENLLE